MQTKIINSLEEISHNYDAIFCDVWGVIHNGHKQYRDAVLALQKFKSENKPVVLITNAPRPSKFIPKQLERMNIETHTYDDIISSGDATINAIKNMGKNAYKIGPNKDEGLYEEVAVDFVGADLADYIICTGPRNDLEETAEHYREELQQLAQKNLPLICANPDRVVQFGGRLITCAGALADVYEEYGGKVIMAGKPYSPIYDLTYSRANEIANKEISKSRILCIGDGIQTDIQGAYNQNYDCLFVTGGIHAAELSNENGLDAQKTASFLEAHGLNAKYAIGELA